MQSVPLDNLAEIRNGYTFRGPVRHEPGGNVRVLQIRDLRAGPLDAAVMARVTGRRKQAPHLLRPGDLVLPARGDHREVHAFTLGVPTIPSSQLYALRVSGDSVLPAYLNWALNQPAVQHAMQAEARGSSMPLLTLASLARICVPLPTLATQRRIVELNELWQREQELTQALLQNRENMLNGIVQQLMNREQTETTGE